MQRGNSLDTEAHRSQIKSRARVRNLAEVYTHKREVDAMLDLVPDMFPSESDPANTDRKFFEPACGSGNFLEEILLRKLSHVTTERFGSDEQYEHRILRAVASIYAIDINQENVDESRDRLAALVRAHVYRDSPSQDPSSSLFEATRIILTTNIVLGDTLADAETIRFIDYRPERVGMFVREWSYLDPGFNESLFALLEDRQDVTPIHYSLLKDHPRPTSANFQSSSSGSS